MGNYQGWLRPVFVGLLTVLVLSGCNDPVGPLAGEDSANPPPTATELIANPRQPLINEDVNFIVRCTGTGVTRSWTFGDGAVSNAISPTHRYAAAGSYTVQAKCSDSKGVIATASTTLVVAGTARLDARFSYSPDKNAAVGGTVTFTPLASGLNYSWDFGDGTSGSGSPATHKYTAANSYVAVLNVTDGKGNSAHTSQTISVAVRNPSVTLNPANVSSRNNKNISFTANGSDPANKPLNYQWDFGDGTVLSGGSTASHSYASNGNYVVTVSVDNGDGGTASASGSVQVVDNRAPSSPVINVGEHQPVGEMIPFAVSSSDPDGDNLTYLWDFGDGQTSTDNAPTHSYPVVGQYTVKVTVTDEMGASSIATATLAVVDFSSVNGRPCVGVMAGQGWCMQNPLPTRYQLNAIDMADNNSGWAVGLNGTVVRTTNAGLTWLNQYTGTSSTLNALRALDANTAWTVGDNGVILKTSNGGQNWLPQSSGASVSLQALALLDANTAWAVGSEGVILKTSDGGASWQRMNSGVQDSLTAVHAIDANNIWAVGVAGTILRSFDGGTSWVAQHTASEDYFRSVYAVDINTVWISGAHAGAGALNGLVRKSNDGGITWVTQSAASNEMLNRVVALDAANAWLTAADGKLYRTSDGGTTWSAVNSGTSNTLYGLDLLDANTLFVAGNSGTLRKSTDAGANWLALNSGVLLNLNSAAAADASTLWAVGGGGTILKTTDGGSNWVQQSSGVSDALNSVAVLDANTVWVVGNAGRILKTSDGGSTWGGQVSGVTSNLNALIVADANTAWAVGVNGVILYTADGGTTWTPQASGVSIDLNGGVALGSGNVWVVGGDAATKPSRNTSGVVLHTSDGGASWSANGNIPVANARFNAIRALDANTLLIAASGGNLWKTTNAGVGWTRMGMASFELMSLHLFDANNMWVVGDGGTIRKTSDAGVTWVDQSRRTTEDASAVYLSLLTTIVVRDNDTAWIVGHDGLILHTVTGGK
ncbi:MAG: PKD domain-containing protein [Chitinivorax sp.]